MELQFVKLVKKVLKEGIGDPDSAAYTAREANKALEHQKQDLAQQSVPLSKGRSGGYDEPAGSPHYIVYDNADKKCQNWYKKQEDPKLSGSTMAKHGWKAFLLKNKGAELKAREFAKKWGLKEPRFVKG